MKDPSGLKFNIVPAREQLKLCIKKRTEAIPNIVEKCKLDFGYPPKCKFAWRSVSSHIEAIEKLQQLLNYLNTIPPRGQQPIIKYNISSGSFSNEDPNATFFISDIPYPQFPKNHFGEELTKDEMNNLVAKLKDERFKTAFDDIVFYFILRNGNGKIGSDAFKKQYGIDPINGSKIGGRRRTKKRKRKYHLKFV